MPSQWPSETREALDVFYGRHELRADGTPASAWLQRQLVTIVVPYPLALSWELAHKVTRVRCHRLVAESLRTILRRILEHYGSLERVRQARMHIFGGVYNYRPISGSSSLSLHAYGAAIDFDPEQNPLGRPWAADSGMMPMEVVGIFEAEGWKWGGRFRNRADCMHFQATA